MAGNLRICPMRKIDAPDVLRMIQALALFHGDPATVTFPSLLSLCLGKKKCASVLVAWAGTERVGFSLTYDVTNFIRGTKTRHIELMFTDKKYRRLGIGLEFVNFIAREAANASYEHVTVSALTKNDVANKFYQKNNFRRRGEQTTQYFLTNSDLLDRARLPRLGHV
jgi:ribosomal protein S18 acetylase RimI-like enzyme